MNRYAVRIGSALALLATLVVAANGSARADDQTAYVFQGKRIVFTHTRAQSGGRAVSIDDPGLRTLLDRLGAAVTWKPGERYVLITTAEPVVVSFAIGDTHYDVGPISASAPFASYMLDGHAYLPADELFRALDLAPKRDGADTVLQPQIASVDLVNGDSGAKLVAHAGIPIDARIVSDSSDRVVIEFEGVGTTLQPARTMQGGPVRRMDLRTQGTTRDPKTIMTLLLAPGAKHSVPGTDDQRDFAMGFNGAAPPQSIAAGPSAAAPAAPAQAMPAASPAASVGANVSSVQAQPQNGSFVVRIVVDGATAYDWHRLRPPDNRWWIDLHGAHLSTPPSDLPGSDAVTGVRVRQQPGDTVRIALSLSDFETVNVAPDASGITITVSNQLADASAPRSGSGSTGPNAAAVAAAPSSPAPAGWKFSPRAAPAPTAYVAQNPRLIIIDPGHGGSDPGSYRGDAIEKNLTLDMSLRLRSILIARGWKVIMTRDTDKDVFAPNDSAHDELQARDDIANNNGARLLVSIHVNAFMNSGPHGATVYYYKANDLALAQAVDHRIASETGIKDDGVVKDKLYVVHHANMPATLVETAFISNPDDRALLMSPDWRQKMALAIADGIADYAGAPPPASAAGGE